MQKAKLFPLSLPIRLKMYNED